MEISVTYGNCTPPPLPTSSGGLPLSVKGQEHAIDEGTCHVPVISDLSITIHNWNIHTLLRSKKYLYMPQDR